MNADELAAINDEIHDHWFSPDDIEFNPAEGILRLRFTRDSATRPPKLLSLKGESAKVLEVVGVDSFRVADTEKVGWYDFNILVYNSATETIDVLTNIPLRLQIHSASPRLRVADS